MQLLTYSSLYPSAVHPQHGVFVENRLRHITAPKGIGTRVVAPVPWFPLSGARFGRYGGYAAIDSQETRYGIEVHHPRYPVIPKIGMSIAPWLMYRATRGMVAALRDDPVGFDMIDAHYFYPDGVAAAMLGRAMGRPVVISARGTDVNLLPDYTLPRRQILWAASQARAIVSVSQALKQRMVEIGIAAEKITVLRNGVDADMFAPQDREAVRAELGLAGPAMVAVGNVLVSKGQDIAIRSLTILEDTELLIVGAGADEGAFRSLALRLGVADRVRFVGRVNQRDLARYFSAADVSVLASMREGWPNVLLESMACGTPVVASDVGGVREIITKPEAGRIMKDRTPQALADAVLCLRSESPARQSVRAYAKEFGWADTARAQSDLYAGVISAFNSEPERERPVTSFS
jgi:glycosyltransferase involved in cell wall biosynthesis